LCTREQFELLAGRGMDCPVFSDGVLDNERETPLDEVMPLWSLPPGGQIMYHDRKGVTVMWLLLSRPWGEASFPGG